MKGQELLSIVKHFRMHFELLCRRYAKFKSIPKLNNKEIDLITYLDIIVVQIRALCIERQDLKKNYTAQNLLRIIGRDDLAQRIDTMLDTPFFHHRQEITTRCALKTLADKFICHYDSFDEEEFVISTMIESQLCNPYEDINLQSIMKVIVDCIGEGLSTEAIMKAYGDFED